MKKLIHRWTLLSSFILLVFGLLEPVTILAQGLEHSVQDESESISVPVFISELIPENEKKPMFFFVSPKMRGTIGEVIHVSVVSDPPSHELTMQFPDGFSLVKEELPAGITAEENEMSGGWTFHSPMERSTFTIPGVSDVSGNYQIRVNDDSVVGTIEIDDIDHEKIIPDEDQEIETTVEEDVQLLEEIDKENPNNSERPDESKSNSSTEEVEPMNSIDVSTWAQFRNAISNNNVTLINVTANISGISGGTGLSVINRNLTINGNGYTINSRTTNFRLGSGRVNGEGAHLKFQNAVLTCDANQMISHTTNLSHHLTFSDITYLGSNPFVHTHPWRDNTVVFDGGENLFPNLSRYSLVFLGTSDIRIINNAVVEVNGGGGFVNGWVDSTANAANNAALTIEKGSSLSIFDPNSVSLRSGTVNVEGMLQIVSSTEVPLLRGSQRSTLPLRLNLGSESEVILIRNGNEGPIIAPADLGSRISIAQGAKFDFFNRSGGGILQEGFVNNTSIQTDKLAVWNLGSAATEDTVPSQVFNNLEAVLTGINGNTIISSNHSVFESTFSRQGLAGYSRWASEDNMTEEPVSPVDPLDPEVEVDPENKPELPEDQGQLSIDFVSQFDFGSQAISAHDQTYYAQPQRLLNEDGTVNEDEERPNYVQVSDRRSENERNGWQLAVTQKEQFQTETKTELAGAQLQLMNQQLVTAQGGKEPALQATNPLNLIPGNKRTLVRAEGNEGTGTWIYRFGNEETAGQSVALHVPKGATPEAQRYSTTLLWELSAVPGN